MTQQASFLDGVIAVFAPTATARSYSDDQWPVHQRTADGVVALLEATPPAKLLDLACGTGASTTALALKGFDVTGLDCTPASIAIARRMSKGKGASVQWLCQDMRVIPL
jgi:2-polyprenyl-3-methyl-5-hydroxy-6-metoxy-1,4-benzoquinol methylase